MTIFISGAGSGIGYDAAMALAKRNHEVIAGVKTENELEKFAGQKNITTVICDITSESDRTKIWTHYQCKFCSWTNHPSLSRCL